MYLHLSNNNVSYKELYFPKPPLKEEKEVEGSVTIKVLGGTNDGNRKPGFNSHTRCMLLK